jgi:hypothetical protein
MSNVPSKTVSIPEQIRDYLCSGGLFNPEMMDHDKVRDLLVAARDEIDRLRAALRRIAEHNHPKVDAQGSVSIWQSGCPACAPTTTAREALGPETISNDPKPMYQCPVEGCPANHESKWQVCSVPNQGVNTDAMDAFDKAWHAQLPSGAGDKHG